MKLLKIAKFYKKSYKFLMIFMYLLILTAIVVTIYGGRIQPWQSLGKKSGEIAVILFCLSLLPGIARRFEVKSNITLALLLARPEIGNSMFIFALLHFVCVRFLTLLKFGFSFPAFFEIFGFISLFLTLPLYLSSSPKMQARLGKNWKKLHSLAYVIVWFILAHVALIGPNKSFLLLAPVATLEIVSLYLNYMKNRALPKLNQPS